MKLIELQESSQRTKNRLKEHGPVFVLLKDDPAPCLALKKISWLVRSEKTGWEGWLPTDEVAACFP